MYGVHPIEQFGPKNGSAIDGWAVLSTVISSLIAPVITASTRNATGSFTIAIIISIAVAIIGMCCIIFTPKLTPYMKKNGITAKEE